MKKPSIVWFRQDLRLEDHPALIAAIQKGGPVIPVFIWAPEEEGEWAPGAASRWWIHYSLDSLQQDLKSLGLNLIIRQHASLNALKDLIKQTGADTVFWNRRYSPLIIQRDAFIKSELQKEGIKTQSFNGRLLFEPWTVFNKEKKPFKVFTPFWKHCLTLGEPEAPLKRPTKAIPYDSTLDSVSIKLLGLLPSIQWDEGIKEYWKPGEAEAQAKLKEGLNKVIEEYAEQRDRPDVKGTSDLSPYLHHGEITSRMIWYEVKKKFGDSLLAQPYLRQLMWREFAYSLLYYYPNTTHEPMYPKFAAFPWKKDYQGLLAWQKGQTGYPIVDAGMRQLWSRGWMHNRVRLIVGSFLVKDLLIPWQEGAKWFWNTLVDADLANNTMGWQWIAGCGADAAPYFRIFNPVTQGEKFDVTGNYVRTWVPEIAALPDKYLQKPWEAPEEVLRQAGITLGVTYPKPIVDHAKAREKALEAFAKI
jgi:deoxyribodipyrimidine photo-lyase